MADAPDVPHRPPLSGLNLGRREALVAMTRRMAEAVEDESLLPATARLVDQLVAGTGLETVVIAREDIDRVAAYKVRPEPNVPLLRLVVEEAGDPLLRFLVRPEAGFEVLEALRSGFQYHWRSDLVRAFDEEAPIVGRLSVLFDDREAVVEHLVVPVVRRHRVRELRGWFAFNQDIREEMLLDGKLTMVRRLGRSRILRLPPAVWRARQGSSRFADRLASFGHQRRRRTVRTRS